jgi:hypothetical protein
VSNTSKRKIGLCPSSVACNGGIDKELPDGPVVVDNLPTQVPLTESELAALENFLADSIDAVLDQVEQDDPAHTPMKPSHELD